MKNGSQIRSSTSSETPGPESITDTRMWRGSKAAFFGPARLHRDAPSPDRLVPSLGLHS